MKLVEGNSVELMPLLLDPVDVIYLDPMFPARQKSSLINKKLQLIQKLEPPCSEETDHFRCSDQCPAGEDHRETTTEK